MRMDHTIGHRGIYHDASRRRVVKTSARDAKPFAASVIAAAMRVLVTGATNPTGEAIVRALASRGHHVRAFGVDAGDERYADVANVLAFPGWVEVAGSVEPALAERQALVHVACLDARPKGRSGRRRLAVRIDRGTLYTRYAAEREQVDHFIHVAPADPGRVWADVQATAQQHVEATRGIINVQVVHADDDGAATAEKVAGLREGLPTLGAITGGYDNAVTA
jgi:NAD(P)-dependent dehydrogenase (short-subunit alcohol dehydrogenase family)